MITEKEVNELVVKAKEDGARLYSAADTIYNIMTGLNWLLGIVGIMLSIYAMSTFGAGGVLGLIFTGLLCLISYISAVAATHIAKVLVHSLFANLAILEALKK